MTDTFFEPDQLKQILSAGWGQISYRQNTELFIQDWHWNPKGTWSDPSGQGYFVGDATPTGEPIRHSYGYALPHRGFTRNGGTEDDGFSRLNDGDTKSYWKSNPYLTSAFTGEDDALHPQWIVIDLEAKKLVNTMRLDWAEPHARVYQVQYWVGTGDAMDEQASGEWKTFPGADIHDGKGGDVTLKLAAAPIELRWVRVLMTQSSNTCDTHGSSDKRNCVGYAINEVYLGVTDAGGKFTDFVRHTKVRTRPTRCARRSILGIRLRIADGAESDVVGRPAGVRPFLYERDHARDAGDYSHRAGVRSAGGLGGADRLHREARLSDRARGDGRRSRWAIHGAGGLCIALYPVGDGAASRRSEFETGLARRSRA